MPAHAAAAACGHEIASFSQPSANGPRPERHRPSRVPRRNAAITPKPHPSRASGPRHPKAIAGLPRPRAGRRLRPVRGDCFKNRGLLPLAPASLGQIDRQPMSDGEEPSAKPPLRRIAGEAPIGPNERILGQILRIRRTARPANEEVDQGNLHPPHQSLEARHRAGLGLDGKLLFALRLFEGIVLHRLAPTGLSVAESEGIQAAFRLQLGILANSATRSLLAGIRFVALLVGLASFALPGLLEFIEAAGSARLPPRRGAL